MVDATAARRAATGLMLTAIGVVAICFVVASSGSSTGKVELAEDCSADPWAPSCHRPSLMDMINGVGHRAQTNAIRQKQIKEALLKQEKANMQKLAAARLKKKHATEKGGSSNGAVGGKDKAGLEGGALKLKSTVYKGLDIGSKKAVDGEMANLLKKGGKEAVEKKATQIREQILADSGKMFGFGKVAGYLPPPPLNAFK